MRAVVSCLSALSSIQKELRQRLDVIDFVLFSAREQPTNIICNLSVHICSIFNMFEIEVDVL